MITKIKVYSRPFMDMVVQDGEEVPFERWHLISICTKKCEEFLTPHVAKFVEATGRGKWISQIFMDITPQHYGAILKRYPWAQLFDEKYAQQLVYFVDSIHKCPEKYGLIIHCDAGISRSGAVGVWVTDYLGMDYSEFMEDNPNVLPNPHVLSLLRKVSGMNKSAFGIILPEADNEV